MTVCVAALCKTDAGESVAVVAADRMVTLGGFIEWEHSVPKMATAGSRALVLVAGDTLTGTRLAREVSTATAGSPSVLDIAQALAGEYEAVRLDRIEKQVLGARGLDFQTFYDRHQSLNPQITMMLDQQVSQFNLGVELLLAGVDPSGSHIFTIHNPGKPENLHDVIGYAAVGSGTIHSLQAMIGFGHSAEAGYHETVFRVYAAKRRSEVAPGVGRDTDMAVVFDHEIHWLTDEELAQLREIYEEFELATGNELTKRLDAFTLGTEEK